MKFLLDESADARLSVYLTSRGQDVTRVGTNYPAGLGDEEVLELAQAEGRILITNDRDFGELVFRLRQAHTGVILFRLGNYVPLAVAVARLEHVLNNHGGSLDQFLVVTRNRVRIGRSPGLEEGAE